MRVLHHWGLGLARILLWPFSTHSVISFCVCLHFKSSTKALFSSPWCREVGMAERLALPAPTVWWCCHLLLSVWADTRFHLRCGAAFPRGPGRAPGSAPLARGCQGKHHSREWIRRPGGRCLCEVRYIKFCYDRNHSMTFYIQTLVT